MGHDNLDINGMIAIGILWTFTWIMIGLALWFWYRSKRNDRKPK